MNFTLVGMTRRNKVSPAIIGRGETKLEGIADKEWARAVKLAALLRPTLGQRITEAHLERLARAAKMSVPNLQRYRRRLAQGELTTALVARSPGFPEHGNRLQAQRYCQLSKKSSSLLPTDLRRHSRAI